MVCIPKIHIPQGSPTVVVETYIMNLMYILHFMCIFCVLKLL